MVVKTVSFRRKRDRPVGHCVLKRTDDGGHFGYTFTELLIVLSILSIVGMLSSVWLSMQIPLYRLNGAVRQVRSDLLAARMQAVSQKNEIRVFFEDAWGYTILDDDNNNGKADLGEDSELRSLRDAYDGVTIRSNNNPIFHPQGTASSLATVTLENAAGEKSITVSITGRGKVLPTHSAQTNKT